MMKKLILATGFGVGYVVGARAGRKHYDALKSKAESVWNNPQVQRAVGAGTGAVTDHAPGVAKQAGAKAKDFTSKVSDKAREKGRGGLADTIDQAGDKAETSARDAGEKTSDAAKKTGERSSTSGTGSDAKTASDREKTSTPTTGDGDKSSDRDSGPTSGQKPAQSSEKPKGSPAQSPASPGPSPTPPGQPGPGSGHRADDGSPNTGTSR